ncbi:Uncharacterized protein Rs2_41008 [Raphanus sativus]|nr:Uncharacterized protein Rs2_41008 [Raphanus sativus]
MDHDLMTKSADPHAFFPDPFVILEPTVKPKPMIIMKNQIPDLAYLSWPVWDVPHDRKADLDFSDHFDDFMMINASNFSKGMLLRLSEDLGRAISSSVHGLSSINHAGSLTSVLLLAADDLITTE